MNKLKKKIIETNNKIIISIFIHPKIKIDKKIESIQSENYITKDNNS